MIYANQSFTQGGLVPLHNACSYGHYEVCFQIIMNIAHFFIKKTILNCASIASIVLYVIFYPIMLWPFINESFFSEKSTLFHQLYLLCLIHGHWPECNLIFDTSVIIFLGHWTVGEAWGNCKRIWPLEVHPLARSSSQGLETLLTYLPWKFLLRGKYWYIYPE